MKFRYIPLILIVFTFISCASKGPRHGNYFYKRSVQTISLDTLIFKEKYSYDDPKWFDEEHTFTLTIVELTQLPVRDTLFLCDSTRVKVELEFWSPWSCWKDCPTRPLGGWIYIRKRTPEKIILDQRIYDAGNSEKKLLFHSRIRLKQKKSPQSE